MPKITSTLLDTTPTDFGFGSLMYRLSEPQEIRGVRFEYVVSSIGDEIYETEYAVFPTDEHGHCLDWGLAINHLAEEGREVPDWVWSLGE